MTVKKTDKPKTDLKDEIKRLMSPEAAKELQGLSPTFQQFLIRWTDLKDVVMLDEIKEFIQDLYMKDNDQMIKNVVEVMQQELRPVHQTLSSISQDMTSLKSNIGEIKDDVSVIKERLDNDEVMIRGFEKRLAEKKSRIEILEKEVKILRPDVVDALMKEIHDFEPVIKSLVKTQSLWNIALRILIAVAISTIVTLLIHYNIPQKYELRPDQRVEIITK